MKRSMTGTNHPRSKLTWKLVEAIREEYKKGGTSYSKLAKKYRVSQGNIGRIIRGELWTTKSESQFHSQKTK